MALSEATPDLSLDAGARVLVVAPHPDDESLAAGGLLYRAARVGAATRVIFLTDGDNNPWPQRWLERRWRIDAAARQRWGARRRAESERAAAALGLAEGSLCRLGWPDLGVTARLVDATAAAVAELAAAIADFRPMLVVTPALDDSHPDHGAAHILVALALRAQAASPRRLAYRVHGRGSPRITLALELDAAELAAKRAAVLAYTSQTSLSRGRLLAMVSARECYVDADPPPCTRPSWPARSLAPWLDLLVVQGDRAWRQRLVPAADPSLIAAASAPTWAKPSAKLPSPWIFDRWGWQRLA